MKLPNTPTVEAFLCKEIVEYRLATNLYIPHPGSDATHTLLFWDRSQVG